MHVAYARSELPTSIFLAGPTPRPPLPGREPVPSWRPEAVRLLREGGFDGTVFVPEDGDGSAQFSYDDQIEWELQALHSATCILFWVPRELTDMPALTTNVEFGHFIAQRNVVYGRPRGAPKNKYLDGLAHMYGKYPHDTLAKTCMAAIRKCGRAFNTSPPTE